jgi:hypothetical protein
MFGTSISIRVKGLILIELVTFYYHFGDMVSDLLASYCKFNGLSNFYPLLLTLNAILNKL